MSVENMDAAELYDREERLKLIDFYRSKIELCGVGTKAAEPWEHALRYFENSLNKISLI